MPKLSPQTIVISDGDVKLYKRPRSKVWQTTFVVDRHQVRVSTKQKNLAEATKAAKALFDEYKFRARYDLPVVTKRFADVAQLAKAEMKKKLEAGTGKKSFVDYEIVIDRYLVPFFGQLAITSIDYSKLREFDAWRAEQMGREPKASTLNTHNAAMNRVFDEAVERGFLTKSRVPALANKKRDSERRPDFSLADYRKLIRCFPAWIAKGRKGKSMDMRLLLRDYVLVLANTGMREGTEAENLRWKHVHQFVENGRSYLEMSVDGKTGRRDIICRANTVRYLQRIHQRCSDINGMTFDQLLKAKLDKPVFRLADGTVTKNLRQTFKAYLTEIGLLKCPKTDQNRVLYSLRHTYATFALTRDGIAIHELAKQMGTSIKMIEDHYSHLTPRLVKDALTGPRYGRHVNDGKAGGDR